MFKIILVLWAMLLGTVQDETWAFVPVTPGAVTVANDSNSSFQALPKVVHDSAEYFGAFRINISDKQTMFVGNGPWTLRYPMGTFGVQGLFQVPAIDGFGFYIEASGLPEIYFRYLWGPGGSNRSFDAIVSAIVNNDSWLGKVFLPGGLGEPFGFEVETFCPRGHCSSRVFPYLVSAPVPEPVTWAMMLLGVLLIVNKLRRRAILTRRRRIA